MQLAMAVTGSCKTKRQQVVDKIQVVQRKHVKIQNGWCRQHLDGLNGATKWMVNKAGW